MKRKILIIIVVILIVVVLYFLNNIMKKDYFCISDNDCVAWSNGCNDNFECLNKENIKENIVCLFGSHIDYDIKCECSYFRCSNSE